MSKDPIFLAPRRGTRDAAEAEGLAAATAGFVKERKRIGAEVGL